MADDLHLPQKFLTSLKPGVRSAVQRYTDRGQPVLPNELQRVLEDVFDKTSEPLRQNWLEIERWADRNGTAPPSLSEFDAFVVGGLDSDNPALRIFTTVYAAIEYLCDTLGFKRVSIGIIPDKSNDAVTTITETGNLNLTLSPTSVRVIGLGNSRTSKTTITLGLNTQDRGTIVWDINTRTFPSLPLILYLENMRIAATGRSQAGAANTWFGSATNSQVQVFARKVEFSSDIRTSSACANIGQLFFAEECSFKGALVGVSQNVDDVVIIDSAIVMNRNTSGLATWNFGSGTAASWEFYGVTFGTEQAATSIIDTYSFRGGETQTYFGVGAGNYNTTSQQVIILQPTGSNVNEIALYAVPTARSFDDGVTTGSNQDGILLNLSSLTQLTNTVVFGTLFGLIATVAQPRTSRIVLDVTLIGGTSGVLPTVHSITGFDNVVGSITHIFDNTVNTLTISSCTLNLTYTGIVRTDTTATMLDLNGISGGQLRAMFSNETVGALSLLTPYDIDVGSSNGVAIIEFDGTFPAGANNSATWIVIDHTFTGGGGVTDHGALTGLADDDHTQYALLAGRATGQTLIGGTASDDDLILESTSDATKGRIILGPTVGQQSVIVNGSEEGITIAGVAFQTRLAVHDEGTTLAEHLAIHKHSDTDSLGAHMVFAKSGGSEATETAVASGEVLGRLSAVGYDGTDYGFSSWLTFEVDGTPGAGDMPGRIVFATSADGAEVPTNRWRINSLGELVGLNSGGGSIIGGTAAGDDLTLTANDEVSFSNRGDIQLNNELRILAVPFTKTDDAGFTPISIGRGETWTLNNASVLNPGNAIVALQFNPIVVLDTPGFGFGMINLFQAAQTVKNVSGEANNFTAAFTFADIPTYQADGATIAFSLHQGVRSAPIFNRINAGVLNVTDLTHFVALGSIGTGVTVTTRRVFYAQNPTTLTGTLATQVGLDIDNLAGATTNIGIRNASTTVLTPTTQAQLTAVGNSITVTQSTIREISASGALTLTSTPTIADGLHGQVVILLNTGANIITLQDEGSLAGSNLQLGAATRALAQHDTIILMFSTTTGFWHEVAF